MNVRRSVAPHILKTSASWNRLHFVVHGPTMVQDVLAKSTHRDIFAFLWTLFVDGWTVWVPKLTNLRQSFDNSYDSLHKKLINRCNSRQVTIKLNLLNESKI